MALLLALAQWEEALLPLIGSPSVYAAMGSLVAFRNTGAVSDKARTDIATMLVKLVGTWPSTT